MLVSQIVHQNPNAATKLSMMEALKYVQRNNRG
jgi:hypothetical protein